MSQSPLSSEEAKEHSFNTFQEMINSLHSMGWTSPCDAQHEHIKSLWGHIQVLQRDKERCQIYLDYEARKHRETSADCVALHDMLGKIVEYLKDNDELGEEYLCAPAKVIYEEARKLLET